nr:MaoC/PaaZ C-terminal domain-containing protein [Rhodococcus sp. (in: high G+C Gram-positive bacteria)]
MTANKPVDLTYADDLEVGARFELAHHTVSEKELVDFASRWDPQRFHTDTQFAYHGRFGGLIASGIHTLAIYQQLAVDGLIGRWSVIAGKSIRQVNFWQPVRPLDTLTGSIAIDKVVLERARGLVTLSSELVNESGTRVLTLTTDALVHRHPSVVTRSRQCD